MRRRGKPTPIDIHVGERIRLRRQQIGRTLESVSHDVDLPYQQLGKYELGKNRISAGKLWELSKIMQIPITFFFEGLE